MLKLLLFVFFCVLASTVTGQSCQFSCNEQPSSDPQTPSNSVVRGKRGVKGEKGEVGGIGARRLEEIDQLKKVVGEQGEIISLLTSLTSQFLY